MNVLLMSTDPVALDGVFCSLVHLQPKLVPTNYHGEKMGLGTWKPEMIQLLTPKGEITMAEAVRRFGNPDFNVDRRVVRSGTWERLAKALNIFQKKPYIDPALCIHCGICVESCPVNGKAVNFKNGKTEAPVYNYKKCIRCFCCQEMCPKKAIKVK
jgi:ferredoxin